MWLDPPQEEQGVSLVGLLHSLRRRWLPASLIGGLLACIVGFVLYLIIPVTYEAISMVRVSQNDKGVFGRSNRWSSGQFDVYKQTQETLMTSPFVLDAALRDPDVLALETIRREDNKLSFLQSELSAKFQGKGEILRLSMRGKRKDDLIKIVDAVIDAYLEEIAASGRRENVERLEILRKARKEHLDSVRETSDKIHRLAEELGTSDSELARMTEQIEMSQLGELERKKLRILNEYEQLYMDLSLIRAKGQSPKIKPHPFDVEMGLA
ncbi:MAG: hypothetical protein AAGF97_13535, partial [Planctomycetota bacterium]